MAEAIVRDTSDTSNHQQNVPLPERQESANLRLEQLPLALEQPLFGVHADRESVARL